MNRQDENIFMKYHKNNFIFFRFIGGWILTKETRHKLVWITYLFIVNILCAVLTNLVQLLHLFQLSSLLKLVKSGFLISTSCMGSIKSYYCFRKRDELLLLIEHMQDNAFLPRNKDQEIIAIKSLKIHKRVKYFYVFICTAAIILSMITPIFSYRERRLIFPSWYPFDFTALPVYILVYVHQVIGDFYISYMNVFLDVLFAGFLNFIGIQCDFLCYELKNLREDRLEIGLRECFNSHTKILR